MLQVYYECVTSVLWVCYKCFMSVLQVCYGCVTSVIQLSYTGVVTEIRVFYECLISVLWVCVFCFLLVFLHHCYYLQTSRDSVSPVGILVFVISYLYQKYEPKEWIFLNFSSLCLTFADFINIFFKKIMIFETSMEPRNLKSLLSPENVDNLTQLKHKAP